MCVPRLGTAETRLFVARLTAAQGATTTPADTRSGAGRSAHINVVVKIPSRVWLVLGLPDGLRRHDSPQQGCTEWTAGGSERSRPGSTSASTATGLSKLPNVLGPLGTVDRCAHGLILLEASGVAEPMGIAETFMDNPIYPSRDRVRR